MSFSAQLVAQVLQQTGHAVPVAPPPAGAQKRPRQPSNDESATDRRVRPRLDAESAGARDDDTSVDGGTRLVPLGAVADTATEEHVRRIMARKSVFRQRSCFMCDFEKYYYNQELAHGANEPIFTAITYGYDVLLSYFNRNARKDPADLGRNLAKIIRVHIADPVKKLGPHHELYKYTKITPEEVLWHLETHNDDPIYTEMECIRTMRQLVRTCNNCSLTKGQLNAAKAITQATRLLHQMNAERVRAARQGGNGNAGDHSFTMDPNRLFGIASTRPLEAFKKQAADALGGATATNTDALIESTAAQRPNMGMLASEADADEYSDDDGAGGSSADSVAEDAEDARADDEEEEDSVNIDDLFS